MSTRAENLAHRWTTEIRPHFAFIPGFGEDHYAADVEALADALTAQDLSHTACAVIDCATRFSAVVTAVELRQPLTPRDTGIPACDDPHAMRLMLREIDGCLTAADLTDMEGADLGGATDLAVLLHSVGYAAFAVFRGVWEFSESG